MQARRAPMATLSPASCGVSARRSERAGAAGAASSGVRAALWVSIMVVSFRFQHGAGAGLPEAEFDEPALRVDERAPFARRSDWLLAEPEGARRANGARSHGGSERVVGQGLQLLIVG